MVIMFEYKETQHLLEMEFKQLEDLDFADDVAEISTIQRQLQEKLKILNSISQKNRNQFQRLFNIN